MCTAITYKTKDFYIGRNLDYEFSYGEQITITPRNYVFNFRHLEKCERHYAMIGMAHIANDYPLYYEAVNEKGLGICGLNFVGNAKLNKYQEGKDNVASFELIPYILCKAASVDEAIKLISNLNLVDTMFAPNLPNASLHYLIADQFKAITLEIMEDGTHIYDNEIGVLTNNPPFPFQMFNLNNYISLSSKDPINSFAPNIHLERYSRGMGAIGLPGDLSSQSRFVRVAYTKANSISNDDEASSISQFFHILESVYQQRGCCEVGESKYEITIYSCCMNATQGIYYYKTYNNSQICAVKMYNCDLDGNSLVGYPMIDVDTISYQN